MSKNTATISTKQLKNVCILTIHGSQSYFWRVEGVLETCQNVKLPSWNKQVQYNA